MSSGKMQINTESGRVVEAMAPVVVSASRSTDIPAFYCTWFVNRLRKGYAVWYNPFNQKHFYISFSNTKIIVFWSKNPRPMMPYLPEIDSLGFKYYFQFTLNDYEQERLEPGVPPLTERIDTFCQLSELVGHEKVIWRADPLIITPKTSVRDLLEKILRTGNKIKGFTDKLVFSFVDVTAYRKVRNNLLKETSFYTKHTIDDAEFSMKQIDEFVNGLVNIQEQWRSEGWDIKLATCAENIDLSGYGIEHNSCIDGKLLQRIFCIDMAQVNLKDKGQRKSCKCIVSKDIGMYNTCRHACVYCYANTSQKAVQARIEKHTDEDESILPIPS